MQLPAAKIISLRSAFSLFLLIVNITSFVVFLVALVFLRIHEANDNRMANEQERRL